MLAGYTAAEMRGAKFSATQLLDTGYAATEVLAAYSTASPPPALTSAFASSATALKEICDGGRALEVLAATLSTAASNQEERAKLAQSVLSEIRGGAGDSNPFPTYRPDVALMRRLLQRTGHAHEKAC